MIAHLLEPPEKEALKLHVPLHEAVEHDPGLLLRFTALQSRNSRNDPRNALMTV